MNANPKKVVTIAAAALCVIFASSKSADAQTPWPAYPAYPSAGVYEFPSGGFVNPERIMDPLTNVPLAGTMQNFVQSLPDGSSITGITYVDPYGRLRLNGQRTDPYGNSTPIICNNRVSTTVPGAGSRSVSQTVPRYQIYNRIR